MNVKLFLVRTLGLVAISTGVVLLAIGVSYPVHYFDWRILLGAILLAAGLDVRYAPRE